MSGTGHRDGDENSPPPGLRPNPLAFGAISLTLPGGGKTLPADKSADDYPRTNDTGGTGSSDPDSGSDATASRSAGSVEPDSEPDDGSAATTFVDSGGDAPDASLDSGVSPAGGELGANFFPPVGGSDRSPDRSVVTVLGAAVAAVLVLGGSVWWLTRPDPPAPPAQLHPVVMPTGDIAAPSAAVVVQDGPLPITIESDCPGQTDPQRAASADANSAWVCPTGGVPFGQQLVVTLPKPYVITAIKFWPGFQGQGADGGDEWYRHRLIKTAQIVFNDPDRTLVSLTPQGERREYAKALNHVLANQAVITFQDTAAPPAAPEPSATAVPPGADPNSPTAPPDLGPLFPSTKTAASEDGPQSSSIAMWGLQLIGHLP